MASASVRTFEELLRWAYPRLGLREEGFRRVRRTVHKRLARRLAELRLPGAEAYRRRLETHPDEWLVLDRCCRIPLSRFWRDPVVFERLSDTVLPALATAALERGATSLSAWSAGCASGEEPYSLSIAWRLAAAPHFPWISLALLATDVEPMMLMRARAACYDRSSLHDLPPAWRESAFFRRRGTFVVRPRFRDGVSFQLHDLREGVPAAGPFDLVLCRNVAFTYFSPDLQRKTLAAILQVLRPGGALVIGAKERLPQGVSLEEFADAPCTFRRRGRPEAGAEVRL